MLHLVWVGAEHLLMRLAQALSGTKLPLLGLDPNGTIVMTFTADRCGANRSLTVFDDGTYAVYMERGDQSYCVDDASLGNPLPKALLNLLAG